MSDRYFTKQTFAFLEALAENNSREWFEAHKQEYEDFVRTPALDFIADMSDEMPAISRHFLEPKGSASHSHYVPILLPRTTRNVPRLPPLPSPTAPV